jgi:hypothetical protein
MSLGALNGGLGIPYLITLFCGACRGLLALCRGILIASLLIGWITIIAGVSIIATCWGFRVDGRLRIYRGLRGLDLAQLLKDPLGKHPCIGSVLACV